ncbi:hypothetical protein LPC10_17645 [Methylorubrum sp. B1-46]|uniref:hypothetical protein n=1 Tax=Methylorubrum TaxID=2282523 RepID=UPI001E4820EA|nr:MULTISPECIES: hypothetical protein [Methylorubrum]MCG5246883.1 hypothetical protein [Methylorubrum extorquens]UGB24755.1 hypothetical protein LPC10_17645 [Methylorubrum sp. B1-46]
MPTFGWVHEDASEAFLSATQKVPDPRGPLPRSYGCPFCTHVAISPRDLQDHLSVAHPVDRPTLLVSGIEPGLTFTVRERRAPSDYILANATAAAVSVDGMPPEPVDQSTFGSLMARLDRSVARIRLSNGKLRGAEPVTTTYDVRFRVAAPGDLDAVDRAFMDHMTKGVPTRETARRFRQDARCQGTGSDYAEGMAEYVLGVLIKEQPHGQRVSSSLDSFTEAFTAALQKLRVHRRPLPHLLCSVMRFALNEFGSGTVASGYDELDAATELLRGPAVAHIVVPDAPASRLKACPLDHGTDRLLGLVKAMSRKDHWSPVLRSECLQVAGDGALVLPDRQKALAVWALTALRLKAPDQAVEPLSQIAAVHPFDAWAQPALETVTK